MKLKELLTLIDDQKIVLMIEEKEQCGMPINGVYSMISVDTKKLKSHPDMSNYLNRKVTHINIKEYGIGIDGFVTRFEIYI